jgi:hypothetical protein
MIHIMKQLTTYLPEDVYTTMTSLANEAESVNAYVRAAVEAENRRRMFAGMDEAIAVTVGGEAEADWHAANAAIIDRDGHAAKG